MYIPFIVELYVVCDPRLHEICALPHVLPPEYCDVIGEAKGMPLGSSHVFVHEAKHAVTFKGPGAALASAVSVCCGTARTLQCTRPWIHRLTWARRFVVTHGPISRSISPASLPKAKPYS